MTLPLAALLATLLPGQSVPNGFQVDTLVQTGLPHPLDFTFLPDGRALIANQDGEIHVYAGGPAVQIGVVPSVLTGHERGLLGIEADPQFAQTGHIYVYYSSTLDSLLHLDRFAVLGDLSNPASTNLALDPASRCVVVDAIPHLSEFHNGGALRFAPDGMLLLGIGDDQEHCDAQTPGSGRGCILRMDVANIPLGPNLTAPPYALLNPGNNPLSGNNDLSQLVVAYGLRNPFRVEIDSLTGNLYIGDVGAADAEEVDEYLHSAGTLPLRNYGWPWMEGNAPLVPPAWWTPCAGSAPPGLESPIGIGDHSAGWIVLIQGPRYRNRGGIYDFGPAYEGRVFYLDHVLAWIRCMDFGSSGWTPTPPVSGQPNATDWGDSFSRVTAMRQGPDGALYMTADIPWWTGVFQRIRPSVPANLITAQAGTGQVSTAGDPFTQPLVVRVSDGLGSPQVGVPVDFSIFGPGTLVTPGPVLTDSLGEARMFVDANVAGGQITVTATASGTLGRATFTLFSRKISVAHTSSLAVVTITNTSASIPTQVPFVVMVALPGGAPWNSPFGTICTNPASPFTIVIEDGLGIFGSVSLSGAGSTGNPGLTRVYQLVPGLLTGLQLQFQAIGLDPIEGMFRTDCVMTQF
ncbi:MAG: PQQ-dependent sugar dehydrogenase [Planctomycetes bacterium]|nr:PQQ-dependent sugar dehydrogenase [Planctomycetota bacterium]MCB9885854.1 PQQ-dependent sugar dehydrogenase [Planctomycetota bacterium]